MIKRILVVGLIFSSAVMASAADGGASGYVERSLEEVEEVKNFSWHIELIRMRRVSGHLYVGLSFDARFGSKKLSVRSRKEEVDFVDHLWLKENIDHRDVSLVMTRIQDYWTMSNEQKALELLGKLKIVFNEIVYSEIITKSKDEQTKMPDKCSKKS